MPGSSRETSSMPANISQLLRSDLLSRQCITAALIPGYFNRLSFRLIDNIRNRKKRPRRGGLAKGTAGRDGGYRCALAYATSRAEQGHVAAGQHDAIDKDNQVWEVPPGRCIEWIEWTGGRALRRRCRGGYKGKRPPLPEVHTALFGEVQQGSDHVRSSRNEFHVASKWSLLKVLPGRVHSRAIWRASWRRDIRHGPHPE